MDGPNRGTGVEAQTDSVLSAASSDYQHCQSGHGLARAIEGIMDSEGALPLERHRLEAKPVSEAVGQPVDYRS